MDYKSAMQRIRYNESDIWIADLEISNFIDGFTTAIKHINRTGETCGDLSPQREFDRYLQKFRNDLDFQEYLDSTEPPVEPSEEELIEWFFH